MFVYKFSMVTLLTLVSITLIGCSQSEVKRADSVNQDVALSQSEIDLMIEEVKTTERARVQAEYAQQTLQAKVFAHLKKMNLPELAGNCLARVRIPAQSLSWDKSLKISKERTSYRAVICPEHQTTENIIKVQARLREKGYLEPIEADPKEMLTGVWGERSSDAMKAYQKDNALAFSRGKAEWTLESLQHLDLL